MKTIEEIKNEVAVSYGFVDWVAVMFYHNFDGLSSEQLSNIVNEVAIEHANQCCEEQKKDIADKFIKECKSKILADQLYTEVLNTPNIVTTK